MIETLCACDFLVFCLSKERAQPTRSADRIAPFVHKALAACVRCFACRASKALWALAVMLWHKLMVGLLMG